MRKHLREELAATAHNQLAGSLLRQGRLDAGGGKPVKQEVYAKQLAASLGLNGLARQTLSAWERATTVVPAAALLASAEVNGVDIGQLVEAARVTVRARIADLEAQLLTATPEQAGADGQSNRLSIKRPSTQRSRATRAG